MAVDTFFWPIKPNWKTPLVETFKWYTTVFRSRSGWEQRRGLRDGNRRGIEYDFLAKEENAQLVDNLLLKAKAQAFWVPDWQYRCVTTADVAIGATVIPGDVTYCPFKAAADIDGNDSLGVVLYRDRDTYELASVLVVADSQLTLTAPTTKAWPAGTTFYPYGKARILGNAALKRLSDQVSQGRIAFENYPGERGSYIPWGFYSNYIPIYEAARPTTTLGGGEILLTPPNWSDGIDTNVEFVGEAADEDTGGIEQFVVEEFGTVTRPMRWLLKSRRQIHLFKEFLGRRWGRRQSFYMPSWTSDLIVTNAIAATDTTIVCKNTGAGLLLWFAAAVPPYPTDVSRYWVMIRTYAHGDVFRRVGLASTDTLSIVLNIMDELYDPAPLGFSLLPSDIRVIHFVAAYRFASDEVSLTWYTDGVAVAEIPVMTVADAPLTVPTGGVNLTAHAVHGSIDTGAPGVTDIQLYFAMGEMYGDFAAKKLNFFTDDALSPGSYKARISVDAGPPEALHELFDEWYAGAVPNLADYEARVNYISGDDILVYAGEHPSGDLATWLPLDYGYGFVFRITGSTAGYVAAAGVWQIVIRKISTGATVQANMTLSVDESP